MNIQMLRIYYLGSESYCPIKKQQVICHTNQRFFKIGKERHKALDLCVAKGTEKKKKNRKQLKEEGKAVYSGSSQYTIL